MARVVSPVMPRDFAVLLPPGWARIPLDGSEVPITAALVAAKVAEVPPPQREQARGLLTRTLTDTLRRARDAGGIDVLVSLAQSHGLPVAASCLVTYLDRDGDRVPREALLAELAAGSEEVTVVEIAGSPALRRRRVLVSVVPRAAAAGTGEPASSSVTVVDFYLPVPGRPGLLALSFATPIEPLAHALTLLFDAIAESLRWQR